ncbi:NepR family anti-sigma factor [Lichenicola sp.]|uniref:NepR family anti-sigma factor n=1 Tax=Lichenicola sp. TaxID=2804529 RepID=UPI003AFFF91E
MTPANDEPPTGRSHSQPKKKRKSDNAFDQWLQRGLHQMFDDVANEPVPDDLLKLIEDDRGG